MRWCSNAMGGTAHTQIGFPIAIARPYRGGLCNYVGCLATTLSSGLGDTY